MPFFRLNQERIARCLGLLARDRASPVPAITVSGGLFLEQVLVDFGRHDRDCHG